VSFSIGFAWGAAAWGGSCCHYGWGGNTMVVNNYNRYNRVNTANVNRAGGVNRAGTWQHNPQHRGGTPYSNQAVANRYGGGARGAGVDNRAAGVGQGQRGAGVGERNAGAGQVGAGAGAGNRPSVPGTTPPDRIGNQNIQRDAGSRAGGNSGFSGGSQGYSGSGARASSARGGASMGGMRGGGGGRRR
jgi:hypothetical protein